MCKLKGYPFIETVAVGIAAVNYFPKCAIKNIDLVCRNEHGKTKPGAVDPKNLFASHPMFM